MKQRIKKLVACSCGCTQFRVREMALLLTGVPTTIGCTSLDYDDSGAVGSTGWDVVEQPAVSCQGCGRRYNVVMRRGLYGIEPLK